MNTVFCQVVAAVTISGFIDITEPKVWQCYYRSVALDVILICYLSPACHHHHHHHNYFSLSYPL